MNDRVDVALAVGADGVHLGEAGLPISAARTVAAGRNGFLIGRSVHSVEGAAAAAAAGADYLLVGTIYATASHPGEPPAGPALLAQVRARVSCPLYAIGGITAANAGECLAAGADGVAVLSAILAAADPEAAAQALVGSLKEGKS